MTCTPAPNHLMSEVELIALILHLRQEF